MKAVTFELNNRNGIGYTYMKCTSHNAAQMLQTVGQSKYILIYYMYSLVNNVFSIDINSYNTKCHSLRQKRAGSLSVLCCRYEFVSKRVTNMWYSLPANVIEATHVEAFTPLLS